MTLHFDHVICFKGCTDQRKNLLILGININAIWSEGIESYFSSHPECDQLVLRRVPMEDPVLWIPDLGILLRLKGGPQRYSSITLAATSM